MAVYSGSCEYRHSMPDARRIGVLFGYAHGVKAECVFWRKCLLDHIVDDLRRLIESEGARAPQPHQSASERHRLPEHLRHPTACGSPSV